ncbi:MULTISPECIES: hypothetical protein [Arthrobacter]|uniref:Uncharacterized protein n=2 Tax=Arthrobacter TaxID=1663 RepID=A0ABU9KLS0_9MICC|nr:hypothetical protein [Arthrobacter sp. YJM1]MDP5228424.1 hypothetical protein [Arthrobacter sp. YJM1]
MFRTLGAICATALLAVGTATVASANTTTTTHSNTINDAIPVTCAGPGVTAFWGTGNSIQHLTVNNAGDSWFTTTEEGQVTLVTTLSDWSTATFTGHVQEWFGAEMNNKNSVTHATFNFQGTSVSDPSMTLSMHAAFTFTTNANGVVTVNNQTVSCG